MGLGKNIALLINPIAGMGGRVGLKGTDGQEILEKAKELGAEPEAESKAEKALQVILDNTSDLNWYAASGSMGEDLLKKHDKEVTILHQVEGQSTPEDTKAFLNQLTNQEIDILLFVGGDGTARNVADILQLEIPALGVPAGVKIHSPVFGTSPEHAGEVISKYLNGEIKSLQEKEVIDIEEEAFRNDEVITELYGYLNVPYDESHMQNLKSPSPQSEHEAAISIALEVIDAMEEDTYYIIGSGTTLSPIFEELDQNGTKLGVDIIYNKEVIKKDASEQEILEILDNDTVKLVVTPMGGQGYLFGRGNPQLSEKVLSQLDKDDITVAATPNKLLTFENRPLLIYTGNTEVDEKLSGYYKVITGYDQRKMYKLKTV